MTRHLSRHVPDALLIAGGVILVLGVALVHVAAAICVLGVEVLLAGLMLTLARLDQS